MALVGLEELMKTFSHEALVGSLDVDALKKDIVEQKLEAYKQLNPSNLALVVGDGRLRNHKKI